MTEALPNQLIRGENLSQIRSLLSSVVVRYAQDCKSGTLIYDSLRKCHQVLLKVLGTFEKRATGHKWKRYHSFFERFLCQSLWNYMMLLNGELQVIQSKCWRLQIVTDNIVASFF